MYSGVGVELAQKRVEMTCVFSVSECIVYAKTRSSSSLSSMLQRIWIGAAGEAHPFRLGGTYAMEVIEEEEVLVEEQEDLVRGEVMDSVLK